MHAHLPLPRSPLLAVVPDEPHQRGDSHLLEVNCLGNIANAVLSGRLGTPDYQSKVSPSLAPSYRCGKLKTCNRLAVCRALPGMFEKCKTWGIATWQPRPRFSCRGTVPRCPPTGGVPDRLAAQGRSIRPCPACAAVPLLCPARVQAAAVRGAGAGLYLPAWGVPAQRGGQTTTQQRQ